MSLLEIKIFFEEEFKPAIHTVAGLMGIFLLSTFIPSYFLNEFFGFETNQLDPTHLAFNFIASCLYWQFRIKRLRRFADDELGILLALSSQDVNANTEITALYVKIKRMIDAENLGVKIRIEILPKWKHPNNHTEAHEIKRKLGAALIIWGDAEFGSIEGEEGTNLVPIRFSCSLETLPENAENFQRNLASMLREKRWLITKDNNLIDRNYLANNLEEVALHVIATSLYMERNFEVADTLLWRVFKKYVSKKSRTRDEDILLMNTRFALRQILGGKLESIDLHPNTPGLETRLKVLEEAVNKLEKIGATAEADLCRGFASFISGDIASAKIHMLRAKDQVQEDEPLPSINLAFINYFEGNVDEGMRYMLEGIRKRGILRLGQSSVKIVSYYEELLNEDSSRAYLHFPRGILYYEMVGDFVLAKESLEAYLTSLPEGKKLSSHEKQTTYESRKRLKKINRFLGIIEDF